MTVHLWCHNNYRRKFIAFNLHFYSIKQASTGTEMILQKVLLDCCPFDEKHDAMRYAISLTKSSTGGFRMVELKTIVIKTNGFKYAYTTTSKTNRKTTDAL